MKLKKISKKFVLVWCKMIYKHICYPCQNQCFKCMNLCKRRALYDLSLCMRLPSIRKPTQKETNTLTKKN